MKNTKPPAGQSIIEEATNPKEANSYTVKGEARAFNSYPISGREL